MINQWLVESTDNDGAVFYHIDSDGNKIRVRVKKENYLIVDGRIFVKLGSEPEWFDPPQQCPI
ncbi:MAG: hypothetical protein A2655_03130 [Candidatus Yanofskybacteria bacterium RIFCSPHIGHO2_01_FULL_43_42]|uniref:Uncharacterized protein n=1 Tax=Candidatus Yanofskybacteria bacterium RIFCSPLOWO2_01_FULL_43_22 TaxID=1802695 RepID=A0A1F8GEW9_9BACT|nr:MAG: hypothetical protein A2655_03130 [Candidatus Yanofskybacteria bacterium RIFCSPHIGHO2_01_FULL_43_42]OGN12994.1 MAG: hypothetical protein A3D48_03790 [Candidatus Yanofskybacteria bacterium RIFCSPHIGHO2_02_FULL_43_17]OGN23925.1 MAG: hypothetical protein A3A13_02465 [Candidatus Yanofskybacteria bacterium RIFCSPLOWO2_01_FULL_43_22]